MYLIRAPEIPHYVIPACAFYPTQAGAPELASDETHEYLKFDPAADETARAFLSSDWRGIRRWKLSLFVVTDQTNPLTAVQWNVGLSAMTFDANGGQALQTFSGVNDLDIGTSPTDGADFGWVAYEQVTNLFSFDLDLNDQSIAIWREFNPMILSVQREGTNAADTFAYDAFLVGAILKGVA
jgi:hypothetical protein